MYYATDLRRPLHRANYLDYLDITMDSPSRTNGVPNGRPRHVKSGILYAISLASVVLSYARGRATGRPNSVEEYWKRAL